MQTDIRPQGGALLPAQPRRTDEFAIDRIKTVGPGPEAGSGPQSSFLPTQPDFDTEMSVWIARQHQWRSGFDRQIGPNVRKYWHLWRNFDMGPSPGPGQEWRDRTVIPEASKIIFNRVPRIVLGMWGVPEPYSVEGRGFRDQEYEEQVRTLLQIALDKIGYRDPDGETFFKRLVDGTTYSQIVGHVWWKAFWRSETGWLRTKVPQYNGDPSKPKSWKAVEILEQLYNGVDLSWLPVTRLALDLYGRPRRWVIERTRTSYQSLRAEQERHKAQHGVPLYDEPALDMLEMSMGGGALGSKDMMEEPRDTEHWPYDADYLSHDPGETPVEMWYCWDNQRRTLTKIANRRVRLAHGLAPTPDGLDPFIGDPAVPIPGRCYGDSILHWTQSLHQLQTRMARARADETLLNMFQQYLYRSGTIPSSTTWFWRPGGGLPVTSANMDKPISDHIYLVPRRPLPPEAFSAEAYLQAQAESVAGADAVSQGVEATNKSRDVTAAEINQRVVQGASRYQLEVAYHEAVFKKPLLQKVFDLLKANLTQPELVRIFDDDEGQLLDLTHLDRPVDIVVGGALQEATLAERFQEMDRVLAMAKGDNILAPWLKAREILLDLFGTTHTLRRRRSKYVKTEQEMQSAQAPAPPPGSAPLAGAPNAATPPSTLASAQGAGGPGSGAAAGLGGPTGAAPLAPPTAPGGPSESYI